MFWKSREFKLVISSVEDRMGLFFGIAAALIAAGISAVIPYIYGRLVDIAISSPDVTIIGELLLFWLFLSILNNILGRYSTRKAYEIATDVTNKIDIDLFHHLLSLPLKFHKEKKMGQVMRRISRGVDELYNFIEDTVFSFLPAFISLIIAIVILLFVEWRLSMILVISSIVYALITLSYTKDIIKTQSAMNLGWEKSWGNLWDSVLNAETVKSATNEEFEKRRNIKEFDGAGKIFKSWRSVWQKMNFWQAIIFSISFVAVFGAGVLMLRNGSLTPGKLIMFIGYTSLLMSPLSRLAEQYRKTRSTISTFSRSIKYYDLIPEQDLPQSKEIKDLKGEVVFENVIFGYKKESPVLKNISFRVGAGETAALVGESGVGKSTLVGLISRYYLPQKGRLLIDDVDIKKIKFKSLREKMAIVPQEVLLFNDTIKNNIRYGRMSATDEEIISAAKIANAHEFIEGFPKKYNQLVGERGIKLSTGQKQRVAIARAILRDPKILILDEATSALDSASEKLVQEALYRLIKGRTTFVIAHRLSTIQHADKIIVLEKGRVAETGTHQELMKNPDGIYRNFWEMQSAIAKIE